MKDIQPITKDEAYRVLRLLTLRMCETRDNEKKPDTLQEAAEQFGWTVAIDNLFTAMDQIKG